MKNNWLKKGMAIAMIGVLSLLTACGQSGGATSADEPASSAAEETQTADSGDTIKIGCIAVMTGADSSWGVQNADGAQQAVDEVNANGGLLGKQVELIVEDDENKPEKSVDAWNKLTAKDNVCAIVGPCASATSLATAPLSQEYGIVQISFGATNEQVTQAGNYVFRTAFIDPFQGQVGAKFAYEMLEVRKAAIIYDNGSDYSQGLSTQFKNSFEELGGEIVAEEVYSSSDQDFSAILAKVKAADPEMVYMPDYYSRVAIAGKQMKEQGLGDVYFMGGDASAGIADNAGPELEGYFYSTHHSPESTDPDNLHLAEVITAKGLQYTDQTALGYDAANIVMQAIERAGSTDRAAIRDEMEKTDAKFVTGHIQFDENRNPIKSATVVQLALEDGQLVVKYYATIDP